MKYLLWHRERRKRWTAVAIADSEPELTRLLPTLPSGETITLPLGKTPCKVGQGMRFSKEVWFEVVRLMEKQDARQPPNY